MVSQHESKDAAKARLAEITEKYRANISMLSSRELLDDFEKRALMASYGYQDPTTAMMLKEAKLELLRRTKGYEPPSSDSDSSEPKQPSPRPTLFG